MENWIIWLIVILIVYIGATTVTLLALKRKAKKKRISGEESGYSVYLSNIADNKNTSPDIIEYKKGLDFLKSKYNQLNHGTNEHKK